MQSKEETDIKSELKELAITDVLKDVCQGRKTGVEENIKNKIVRKILNLLGWNEDKDFDYEFPIRNKRADISLKYERKVKVIVETKSIEKNLDWHQPQALEYARSKGVDWAILTNGVETRLYKSFISGIPDERNKPILTVFLENLEKDFDKLYNFVGKENFKEIEVKTKDEIKIIKEKIEAEDILYILTEYKEKLTKDIKERFERDYVGNSEFKEKINDWINETNLNVNEWLDRYKEDKSLKEKVDRILKEYRIDSFNIEKYLKDNDYKKSIDGILNKERINTNEWVDKLCEEGVYTIINRVLFFRICEDRNFISENEKLLLEELIIYKRRHKNYASKLLSEIFEGQKEKFEQIYDLPIFDHITFENIDWNETRLEELITKLKKYNLKNLRRDIIGDVYEKHLSDVLKKETGTYYTPTYIIETIVDYVFENYENNNLENLRILDPSCGSGSFLLYAYDKIKEKYGNREDSHVKILENNIYGVDLNPFAVQLTIMSLALKDLENSSNKFNILDGDSVLGKISTKYRNENSKIGDFVEIKGSVLLRHRKTHERRLINIFQNKYNIIIGNPPYYNMQWAINKDYKSEEFKKIWENIYTGENDILYYFIAQGINLLKHRGLLGYITTRYWLEATYSKKLRKFILENCCIKAIVDFRDVRIFESASNHTCLLFLQREEVVERKEENSIKVVIVKKKMEGSSIEIQNEKLLLHIRNHFKYENYSDEYIEVFNFDQSRLTEDAWVFVREDKRKIIEKMTENASSVLSDICFMGQGMITGLNEAFVVDGNIVKEEKLEKELLKKLIKNSDIGKYIIMDRDMYLIYMENVKNINDYPSVKKHLEFYKEELERRYTYEVWYKYKSPQSKELFENYEEKIVVPYRAEENRFALDTEGYFNDGGDIRIIVLKNHSDLSIKYILALLNSKLIDFYFKETGKKKGNVYEYFSEPLGKIPIKKIDFKNEKEKEFHDKLVKLADKRIELTEKLYNIEKRIDSEDKLSDEYYGLPKEEKKLKEEIESVDKEIDKIVYGLYGIEKEEIEIIDNKGENL